MIMNVMCPGGLVAAGRVGIGVHSTQKVRVMHAVIRYMVEHDSSTAANPTEPELRKKFGRPITQEDLAFTLLTFSYVAVRSFVKLGVRMTDADKNNYVHCWNVLASSWQPRGTAAGRLGGVAEALRGDQGTSGGGVEGRAGADRGAHEPAGAVDA